MWFRRKNLRIKPPLVGRHSARIGVLTGTMYGVGPWCYFRARS
jgi:hypothetical protein